MTKFEVFPIVVVVAERPIRPSQELIRILYRCETCGTETMRTNKQANSGARMHTRAVSG
jgi:hypothetical protein